MGTPNPPPGFPAPPGSSAPPMWLPVSPSQQGRGPMMNMLGMWAGIIGFLLVFVGVLVVVAVGNVPSDCIAAPPASSCPTSAQNALTALTVGEILLALGLFGIGARAGIKLEWGSALPASATSDEVRAHIHSQWRNSVMLIIVIVLLFVVFFAPPVHFSVWPGGI